jgi:hypothetical protein
MKTIKNILLMTAVAGTLFVASCTKEPVKTTTTSSTTGVLTCKVNGTAWQSEPASKMYITPSDTGYGTSASIFNGELGIQGVKIIGADTSRIAMQLVLTPAKTGTYSGVFNLQAADGALYLPKSDMNTLFAIVMGYTNSYSVTLTKVDESKKLVSGVFTITMKAPTGQGLPDYIITEGKFDDIKLMQ